MSRIRLSILALLLIGTVGACTSAASPSAEEATPTPTEEPTPTPTEAASEGGGPSLEPGASDLEGILPDEVGGLALTYESAEGAAVFGSETLTPEVQTFLQNLGADPSQVSMAFGFAFDANDQTGVSIMAIRVEGADESQLRSEFRTVMEQEGDTATEETVGGKNVLHVGTEGATEGYLYVKDDVAFLVSGEPAELADEALAALP